MALNEKQIQYRKQGIEASYLAACALHDQMPVIAEDVEWDKLFKFCKFHSITAIVAIALEMVWKDHPADDSVMKPWRQARDQAIRKNILLNAERERILAHLESIGCWYMPLKGSLLQYDYPKFGMRQMSDNDILCDPAKTSEIRTFMLNSGYTCGQYLQGHHDEYSRKPVYNFEIHRRLFKPELAPLLAEYYADIRERCLKDEGNACGYHMSRSDFYIYFTAHAFNHFQESGIGIRHLLDTFIFLGKYESQLNKDYVDQELEKLGALGFERWCARISRKLLSTPDRAPDFADEDWQLLDAFFCSGTHGIEAQLFRNAYAKFSQGGKRSKFRYFLNRMFPSAEFLSGVYPIVKRYKWLVPFIWIHRLVRSVFVRPGRVFRETQDLLTRKKSE